MVLFAKIIDFFKLARKRDVQATSNQAALWKYNTLDDLKAAKLSSSGAGLGGRNGSGQDMPAMKTHKKEVSFDASRRGHR